MQQVGQCIGSTAEDWVPGPGDKYYLSFFQNHHLNIFECCGVGQVAYEKVYLPFPQLLNRLSVSRDCHECRSVWSALQQVPKYWQQNSVSGQWAAADSQCFSGFILNCFKFVIKGDSRET